MQNTNIKLSISTYLGILFLCCLFVAIYLQDSIFQMVKDMTGEAEVAQAQESTNKVSTLLVSLSKINFETKVLNSQYFETLVPFVDFPIDSETLANFGKANPFIGSFTVVTERDSGAVGGLIYSGQRSELNNGNAVRSVPADE